MTRTRSKHLPTDSGFTEGAGCTVMGYKGEEWYVSPRCMRRVLNEGWELKRRTLKLSSAFA